jgi:hypothetical protein
VVVDISETVLLGCEVGATRTALLASGVVRLLLAREEHFSGFFWQSISPGIGSENASFPHASIMSAMSLRDIIIKQVIDLQGRYCMIFFKCCKPD